MHLKKWLALLLSAALVVGLLAGCGGSKALSDVTADLLSGLYDNVAVEVDPDLTAALKKAVKAGGTEEEIYAALLDNLNLSGSVISFDRLASGQKGDHGVNLLFYPGSDSDAAARSAVTQWGKVFGSLPKDGSYRAHVSMIEAENGYCIAVDVEVLKAGKPDKDDDDDDTLQPEDPIPEGGYTYDEDTGIYTVYSADGLKNMAKLVNDGKTDINITLTDDIDLTGVDWTLIGSDDKRAYKGDFDGGGHTISNLQASSSNYTDGYVGLFGVVGSSGTVKNLVLKNPVITSGGFVGAVAGKNAGGTIEGCSVEDGKITGNNAGGVVGLNRGTITACYWSDSPADGIGQNYGTGTTTVTQVNGSTTWANAATAMNTAILNSGVNCLWHYDEACGSTPPQLAAGAPDNTSEP